MAAIGGNIKSISINGRAFSLDTGNDPAVELGYDMNEIEPNGDGTVRKIAKAQPWCIEGVEVTIDHARADLEFLGEVQEQANPVPVSVIFADGSTYAGEGTISGDGKYQPGSATRSLDLKGGGKLRNVT